MSQEEVRQDICEGCLTGNLWLCRSFPGSAKKHVEREQKGTKEKKQRRLSRIEQSQAPESERPSPRIFRRK